MSNWRLRWFRWQKVGHRCTSLTLILLFDLSLSPSKFSFIIILCPRVFRRQRGVCLPRSVRFTVCHLYFKNKLCHFNRLLPAHLFFCFLGFCPTADLSVSSFFLFGHITHNFWNDSQVLNNEIIHNGLEHFWLKSCKTLLSHSAQSVF